MVMLHSTARRPKNVKAITPSIKNRCAGDARHAEVVFERRPSRRCANAEGEDEAHRECDFVHDGGAAEEHPAEGRTVIGAERSCQLKAHDHDHAERKGHERDC